MSHTTSTSNESHKSTYSDPPISHDLSTNPVTTESATKPAIALEDYICPITQELIRDPVMTPYSKYRYEREELFRWVYNNLCCPVTRLPMRRKDIVEDIKGREELHKYDNATIKA